MASQDTPSHSMENSTSSFNEEDDVYVELTHNILDALSIMNQVRSPQAGAIVLFAGTD